MADNTTLNTGVGGDTIATDDIGGVKFQRIKLIHGNDGVNDGDVSATNPLPTAVFDGTDLAINSLSAGTGANGLMVAQGATNFFVSTANSSTAQLAAAATFNGTIESVLSAPYASIIIDTDQTGTLVVKQYITSSAATQIINTTFNIPAKASGSCFGRSFPINGNFFSISYTNTGGSATTTLNINVAYGNIDATTQLLNLPVSLNEINGTALTLGQKAMAGSIPFTIASDQSSIPVAATLQAGSAVAGKFGIDQTTPGTTNLVALTAETTKVIGTVNPPAITKGTQSANGFTIQSLNDAGRNAVHFYTVIPVLATATDTLQSLTGTKAGATVTATTTPAVVTTAKTFRVTRFAATYVATATSGYGIARLRFNTAGVVAVTSPIAATIAVGAGTPATANSAASEEAAITDGWEFAAGTGVGVSVQGFAAATATAVGYMFVSMTGYEY
jgi:hypothetical protein